MNGIAKGTVREAMAATSDVRLWNGNNHPVKWFTPLYTVTSIYYLIAECLVVGMLSQRLVRSPLFAKETRHISIFKRCKMISTTTWLLWLVLVLSKISIGGLLLLQHLQPFASDSLCRVAMGMDVNVWGITRVTVFLFLIERGFIVRRRPSRLRDPIYLLNLIVILPMVPLYVLVNLQNHRAFEDGTCKVQVGLPLIISFFALDMLVNFSLTLQFLTPWMSLSAKLRALKAAVLRQDEQQAEQPKSVPAPTDAELATQRRMKRLAKRTILACALSSLFTLFNGVQLAVFDGKEPLWVAQLCCATDLLVTCLVLHFLMTSRAGASSLKANKRQRNVETSTEATAKTAPTHSLPALLTTRTHSDSDSAASPISSTLTNSSSTTRPLQWPSKTIDESWPGKHELETKQVVEILSGPAGGRPSFVPYGLGTRFEPRMATRIATAADLDSDDGYDDFDFDDIDGDDMSEFGGTLDFSVRPSNRPSLA
ncbi:hypothetical protein PYCC9005_005912 [Savitreella phatthalungensis]